MAANLDSWKRIVLDPCNRTAQRRNEAATRDAFEEIVNYITNISNVSGDAIIFFEVQANAVGDPSVSVRALDLTTFNATGDFYTAYDPSGNGRFSVNFYSGALGCGRLATEIAEDALVIIELDGPARFVQVTFTTDMWAAPAGQVTADVDNYHGAYPNSRNPGASITVYDRLNIGPHSKAGDLGLAVWDDSEAEYVLVAVNDEEMIFFQLDESQLNQKSCLASEMTIAETFLGSGDYQFQDTGRTIRVWDLSTDKRFSMNFVSGYYGIGRQALEIGNDHVVVVELEGKARFIDGPANTLIPLGGRGNVTVLNAWGGYPNARFPGADIEVFDRNSFGPVEIGEKCLAVWDEDAQEYILLFAQNEPENIGEIGIGEICNPTTNSCCVFDGLVRRNQGPTGGDGCLMDICAIKVWIACETQNLDPDTNYCGTLFSCTGSKPAFCDWVRDTGTLLTCDGSERPVWAMACPCPDCECPEPCETVYGVWNTDGTICDFPRFELNCVTQDPITGTTYPGEQVYWGEFQITGKYPLMGLYFPLDPLNHPDGIDFTPPGGTPGVDTVNVDGVIVVWYPGGDDPCDGSQLKFYVEDLSGIFHEIGPSGVYLDPAGSLTPPWIQIVLDETGCTTFVDRTFYYGMLAKCNPSDPIPDVAPIVLYHLPGGTVDGLLSRTTDTCLDCDAVSVPGVGAPDYEDPQSSFTASTFNICCGVSQIYSLDVNFGTNASPVMTAAGCGAGITAPDGNSVALSYSPMLWHVFGGCIDYYAAVHGTGVTPAMNVCGGNTAFSEVGVQFLWAGVNNDCT